MLYECVDEYLESEYKIEQLSDSNKITFPQRTLNLISLAFLSFGGGELAIELRS